MGVIASSAMMTFRSSHFQTDRSEYNQQLVPRHVIPWNVRKDLWPPGRSLLIMFKNNVSIHVYNVTNVQHNYQCSICRRLGGLTSSPSDASRLPKFSLTPLLRFSQKDIKNTLLTPLVLIQYKSTTENYRHALVESFVEWTVEN